MAIKVIIEWQGLDTVISNLSDIQVKAPKNLERQMASLAGATEDNWKENTPKGKTGRLRGGDVAEPDGLSFTLRNSVQYYKFVDEGHNTPKGWRTKHGYRLAKRRSHVAGREITSKTVQFIEQNLLKYLSKFLE
jgi:hypothetical protein